jgi:hypothetical protein
MARHTARFAFVLVLLAGNAHGAPAPHKTAKPFAGAGPARVTLDADVYRTAIRNGRAIPNSAGLTLVLSSGRHLSMVNNTRGCPIDDRILDDGHCYRYSLVADMPARHVFIVREAYYEGESLFLIDDRTGRQTGLDGMPVFSPDGSRFFVADDETAGDHDNNLEVWRRDGDGAVIEWAHPVKQVHVEAPALKQAYRVTLTDWSPADVLSLAFAGGGRNWTGRLTRGPKGWTLAADWPKP